MRYIALAILTAGLLTACQGSDAPHSSAASKPAGPHLAPKPKDDPTSGMTAEQLAKYQASVDHFKDITLGQPAQMIAQTEHRIAGTQDTLEFQQIRKDTRCPDGVQCIWAGEISVLMKGTIGGKSEQFVLGNKTARWKNYQLTIREVSPHPTQNATAQMPTLTLQVDKLGAKVVPQDVPGTIPPHAPPASSPLAAPAGGARTLPAS